MNTTKEYFKQSREIILRDCKKLVEELDKAPTLAIITCGDDEASKVYIRNKIKTCQSVGIDVKIFKCTTYEDLLDVMYTIPKHIGIDGVILQLPLPEEYKKYEQELIDLIPPEKDVDGLTTTNIGKLWLGEDCFRPATAFGVSLIMGNDLTGKRVVVINRSNLIGKPLAKLLLDKNATVTIAHSKTDKEYLKQITSLADYVIVGIGKAGELNWLVDTSKDTIWIDCGINRDENGKVCGDITIESNKVTPVPGSVGTLTTACLAWNVACAANLRKSDPH